MVCLKLVEEEKKKGREIFYFFFVLNLVLKRERKVRTLLSHVWFKEIIREDNTNMKGE